MKSIIVNTRVDNEVRDILIEDSRIEGISSNLVPMHPDARIIDGSGTAAVPSLINGHTHSPMSLLRGAGDDLHLHEWLTERMWPLEKQYTEADFYWGNRLALAEMIRTGTGFFNEMYMSPRTALRALEAVPMKALVHFPIIDGMDEEQGKLQSRDCERFFAEAIPPSGVGLGVALHAVYTASRFSIEWVRDFSAELGLKVHIHLAETDKEVSDCRREHDGLTPVEYLNDLGLLSDRVVAAHAVHLTDRDIDILADRGVTVVHNPASNMKLSSGVFPYFRLKERGIPILLGTDGAASNNNLDMVEEMKLAALLLKVGSGDATLMTAKEIFRIATEAGADFFGTGGGAVRVGMEADLMLVDITGPEMIPLWDLTSSLVYGASGQCVKTLLSAGRVLMENRIIPGFDEIRQNVQSCFDRLRRLIPETV
jgi:5-methylthioadenosine/S-adenosylhomocysteine deaminase